MCAVELYRLLLPLFLIFHIVKIFLVQVCILFERFTAHPVACACTAPVTADYSDSNAKPCGKLLCVEIRNCAPRSCAFAVKTAPACIFFVTEELFIHIAVFLRVVIADVFGLIVSKKILAAHAVLKLKLHIALTACEPYLAYHNVTEYDSFFAVAYLHLIRAACFHRRKCNTPLFIDYLCYRFVCAYRNYYAFAVFARAEYSYVLLSLKHHIAAEYRSRFELSHCLCFSFPF